jgi:cytochrome c biogenesis protein CcmG, thiol:disulfide interchange protein DsbE
MRAAGALGILGLSVAAACSGSNGTGDSAASNAGGRVEVGIPAPDYRSLSLDGDSVSLAGLRGKVVLLNVWATWCHPCRTEIPELREIHAQYAPRGLELIGVSVDADGSDQTIRQFMEEFQMTYPIWRDPDERVSARFLIVGVPATFLIDREGILRWRKTGPIAPNDTGLSRAIERALGT